MWKTAFDKVNHDAFFISLVRMNVPDQIVKTIKSLYKNPQFCVEMDGETTGWTNTIQTSDWAVLYLHINLLY